MEFIDSNETIYNFSPSLQEAANLGVRILPESLTHNHFKPKVCFKLQIVREIYGDCEQHIDWVDVDDPGYQNDRELNFSNKLFI